MSLSSLVSLSIMNLSCPKSSKPLLFRFFTLHIAFHYLYMSAYAITCIANMLPTCRFNELPHYIEYTKHNIYIPRTPAFLCSPSIHMTVVHTMGCCILSFIVRTRRMVICSIAYCLVWSSLWFV